MKRFLSFLLIASLMLPSVFAQNNSLQSDDPELAVIMQRVYGKDVRNIGNLDMKTRELVSCVALTTLNAAAQLKTHINAALDAGATPVEMREVIYLVAPFRGFPYVLNAVEVMNEVFRERGVSLPLPNQSTVNDENRHQTGDAIQSELYNGGIGNAMKGLPGTLGEDMATLLTDFCFGDIYSRNGLPLEMHELYTYVVLTVIQANSQLHSHFLGCLKAGNSAETVVSAVIQCLPHIGFPSTINTLRIIREVLNEQNKAQADAPQTNQAEMQAKHGVKLIFPAELRSDESSNTGESYLTVLKNSGNNLVANFLFTRNARNYWHMHPDAEQTLMILDGEAYYQEEGQPKRLLKPGDVVVTKANTKHWNGATENGACTCITITEKNDKAHAEWFGPVTDEEFLAK